MAMVQAAENTGDCRLIGLRRMALDQVCLCLASADPTITTALFSRLCSPSGSGGDGGVQSLARDVEHGVGIPSSIGDAVLKRAGETGCLTDQSVLELLRWCVPRCLFLNEAPLTVTDSLLVRYPAKACAELEEVRLGWSPHLRELDAVLLHIRKAGADGQDDEPCALRLLDVSGHEHLSDGILKALAGRCPALRSLTVDGCRSLDGSFLERLSRGCPSLCTLSADACTGLNDGRISNFIVECEALASKTLTCLRLGGCPVGALTCQALMQRGGCLRTLHLDGCSELGDAAVRMICRACPRMLELSLLGCSKLSCRGAWQCTQHTSLETLSITLPLLPSLNMVPPEDIKRKRGGDKRGARAASPTSTDIGEGGRVGCGPGSEGGREQWACDQCTLVNPGRKSVCQACKSPRGSTTPPSTLPLPPAPQAANNNSSVSPLPSPLPSPCLSSPNSSASPSRRAHHRRSRQRERQRDKKPWEFLLEPLPLPPVPHSGPLRRLRLELSPVSAAEPSSGKSVHGKAAVAVSSASFPGDGREEMGAVAGGRETGSTGDTCASQSAAAAAAAGRAPAVISCPLRRIALLLPPSLTALDVRASNAPPPPSLSHPSYGGGAPDPAVSTGATWTERGGKSSRQRNPKGFGNNYVGNPNSGAWREGAFACGGTQAPLFESGGSGEGKRRGGGGDGGGNGSAAWGPGVDVVASPVDLAAILQSCPVLHELTICGNPHPRVAHAPSGARIRGRGKEALTTTALAGIHATAAAVAHSFRLHNAGGGGANSNETDSPSAAAPSFAPGSPLRALTLMDCPSLPPLAILEALSIVLTSDFGAANTQSGSRNAGGATWSGGKFGLAHVALGYSTAIPLTTAASPSSSSLSVAAVPSTCASAAHSRRCRLTAASIANGTGASRGGDETPSAAWVGSEEEDGGAGGLGGSLDEGMVRLASESLESVTVVGEVQLSALVLSRCWRLRRLELLQCRRLWRLEAHSAPVLTEVHAEGCCLGNKDISSLTKGCWGLEVLNVGGNDSLGDQVLESALADCTRLRLLRMHGCSALGDRSTGSLLPFLLNHVPPSTPTPALQPPFPFLRLEELTISHAPRFNGGHFVALAGALPRLRRLSISHCRGFIQAVFSEGQEEISDGDSSEGDCVREEGGGWKNGVEGWRGGGSCSDDGEEDESLPNVESPAFTGNDDGFMNEGEGNALDGCYGEGAFNSVECLRHDVNAAQDKDGDRNAGADIAADEDRGALPDDNVVENDRVPENAAGRGGKSKKGSSRRRKKEAASVSIAADAAPNHSVSTYEAGNTKGIVAKKISCGASEQGTAGKGKKGSIGSGSGAVSPDKLEGYRGNVGMGRGVVGKQGGGDKGVRVKRGGDAEDEEEGEGDVCQGLEFTVDGKTRAKLERLAAALPRESGKKRLGRPSCIRFLQERCPHAARDCTWAHIPMHPPKTLKFKPLIVNAHEPASTKSPSTAPTCRGARALPGGHSAGSIASATTSTVAAEGGVRPPAPSRGVLGNSDEGALFRSLQFLDIHDCPRLKALNRLRCPCLAVAQVISCRELTSLALDAPIANRLNVSGCVRLEPWELSEGRGAGASLHGLQVAVLNYCRALTANFLALLVDHARNLNHLEIYGAAIVMGPHGNHAAGSSHVKKELSGSRRRLSRVDYNRINAKTTALLKSLSAGRPNLTVVRTKKDLVRGHEGVS